MPKAINNKIHIDNNSKGWHRHINKLYANYVIVENNKESKSISKHYDGLIYNKSTEKFTHTTTTRKLLLQ